MRIAINIERAASGWNLTYSSPDDPNLSLVPRTVAPGPGSGDFPVPPAEEWRAFAEDIRTLLVQPDKNAQLNEFLAKCRRGEPREGQAALLGGYLHAVLFGPHWAAIEALPVGSGLLEIYLQVPADDLFFAALPWEIMHAQSPPDLRLLPLAAHPRRNIIIVRPVAESADAPLQPLELPLRVLFVVGRQLDDALRPGAEYIGLLRRLGLSPHASTGNARIRLRIITETTGGELKDEVEDFKPHVVHFICHGEIDEKGQPQLLLTKREFDDPTRPKTSEPDPFRSPRLLEFLRQPEVPRRVPCVVVLNACHTGNTSVGEQASQSLAAQLVAGGIPVVLGMAGRVDDGVCRLYTRGFYEALLAGTDLPTAAAHARRSAMLFYGNYDLNVEWARLTFFAKAGIPLGFDLNGAPSPRAARIAAAAAQYFPTHGCLLCDRMEALRAYERFRNSVAADKGLSILSFGVIIKGEQPDDKFSKTMLLDTIAVQSVLDGFVPCKLLEDKQDPPANLLDFALQVHLQLDVVRERKFGVAPAAGSEALDLAIRACPREPLPAGVSETKRKVWMDDLCAEVRSLPPKSRHFQPKVIRAALNDEFKSLRRDLEPTFGSEWQALVLIDDLHRYEGVTESLLKDLIDEHGLAHDGRRPVPLIISYSQYDHKGVEFPAVSHIKEFLKLKATLVLPLELNPIGTLQEQLLAYSQYLLTHNPPLAPNTSPAHREHLKSFFNFACSEKLKGVPSRFAKLDLLAEHVKICTQANALVNADDEMILVTTV